MSNPTVREVLEQQRDSEARRKAGGHPTPDERTGIASGRSEGPAKLTSAWTRPVHLMNVVAAVIGYLFILALLSKLLIGI
jgi:hypothetical protein